MLAFALISKELSFKGTQTSQYDRKLYEGISQRQSISRLPPPQDGKSLAEAIVAVKPTNVVEQETTSAVTFIQDEVR